MKLFSGARASDSQSWPLNRILNVLGRKYGKPEELGEDGVIKVYGVRDNDINFAIAFVQTAPGSGKVIELGFLARFTGFSISGQTVETLNRKLHISVASVENGDLFLLAGLQITGAFDESAFNMIVEAWRHDLMVVISGLTGQQSSMSQDFPAARFQAARAFATNEAPAPEIDATEPRKIENLSSFLGATAAMSSTCGDCKGRGKRGLIARECDACEGSGFVTTRMR